MKQHLLVALSILALAGAVEFSGRALNLNQKHVLVADGSDPMPLCRKGYPNCPQLAPLGK